MDDTFSPLADASIGSGAYSVPSNYGQQDAMANHPSVLVQNGVDALNDPNNGMDFQTRMHLVEPLLRAQHFGAGGGLKNGQGFTYPEPGQQSQGQIISGKPGDGGDKAQGIIGKIGSVAALL